MTLIPAGALGVDNSFSFPDGDQLERAGVRYELRYASNPDDNPKNWTLAQLADRHARGIATGMIHEQLATDHLGGEALGRAKADVFARRADQLSWSRDDVAWVACDSSPTAGMLDYAGGWQSRMREAHGFTKLGTYGGVDHIQQCWANGICTDGLWQAYGWSALTGRGTDPDVALQDAFARARARWGAFARIEQVPGTVRTVQALHLMAHVFQRLGRVDIPADVVTSSIDENITLRPTPFWLPGAPATENTVTIYRVQMAGTNALFIGEFDQFDRCFALDWIETAEDATAWAGAPMHAPLSVAQVRNMTVDVVPQGDGAYAWTAGNFRRVRSAGGGQVGPQGVPGPRGADGIPGPAGPAGASPDQVLAALKARLPG